MSIGSKQYISLHIIW